MSPWTDSAEMCLSLSFTQLKFLHLCERKPTQQGARSGNGEVEAQGVEAAAVCHSLLAALQASQQWETRTDILPQEVEDAALSEAMYLVGY